MSSDTLKSTLYDGTVVTTPRLEGDTDHKQAKRHRDTVRGLLKASNQERLRRDS